VTGVQITHIGGPTALIEVGGWRLLTDPTVREVAARLQIDTAILHLGGVQFPVTGPVRYSMTAQDAIELCSLIRLRTAIPIHYEGWKHFREGRDDIERELAGAPEDIRERIQWLPVGVAVELGV
jgi:L-ascorbate metabolism protein UlaG (beta-lactamase superfamily)